MATGFRKREVWFWGVAAFIAAAALYPGSFLLAIGLYALGVLPKASHDALNSFYAPIRWVWGLLF
jgi:hypothetical protein